MCFTEKKSLLVILMVSVAFSATSQSIFLERDSLPIVKPRPLKNTYKVNHPDLNEISIKTKNPTPVGELPKKFWGNLAGGVLTLMSGINTTSSQETLWVMQNELISTNGANSWQVPLFFSGEYVKNRERVKNDDGTTSVETQKGVYIDWSKGGSALIIEKGDTLGGFDFATNLQEDTMSLYWLERLEADNSDLRAKLKKYQIGQMNYNLQTIGTIRGKFFYMVTSGNYFKSVIIIEGEPRAIFQSDPNFIILDKKDRISPYLLFANPTNEEDRTDLIRLALLNALLSRCVSVDFYDQ